MLELQEIVSQRSMMGNLLEGLLSGLTGGSSPTNFIGNLLSGVAPQGMNQMGGLGNLLQRVTNGGGSNAASNQFLGPLVGSLGSNLNMSPNVSEQVISFALHHLTNGHLSGAAGYNHTELMNQITSGSVNKDFLQQTGLPQQLAQQAGIDPKVATDGLKHVLEHFGQHMK